MAGGLIAYFIATFVFYWWHRLRHESRLVLALFHQIHHSPQRLEVITSFYKHPVEMVVNSLIGSVLVYTLLGLSPEAGAVYTALHRARRVLLSHQRAHSALGRLLLPAAGDAPHPPPVRPRTSNNYGDITWWDMLFGTYENPARFGPPAASTMRASSVSATCCAGATSIAADRPAGRDLAPAQRAIENSTALLTA